MPERPRRWTPTAICGAAPRTEHAMPRPVSCWNRRANTGPHRVPQASDLRKYARSYVETELHVHATGASNHHRVRHTGCSPGSVSGPAEHVQPAKPKTIRLPSLEHS